MRMLRFTETQIVGIGKEADTGMKLKELCRKHGMFDATYYEWKSKCGGMDVFDRKRVRGFWGGERKAQAHVRGSGA